MAVVKLSDAGDTVAAILVAALAACSSTRLSDGLTQRMDSGTAQLNTADAIGIINHYRSTVGVGPLIEDPALSAQAKTIAANYARTGRQAAKPEGSPRCSPSILGPATRKMPGLGCAEPPAMCRQISAAKAVIAASWPMRCLRVWVTSSRIASS